MFATGAYASMDSGIDSDMGILINGGTVIATGNMLDRIENGGQTHAVFSFAQSQNGLTWTLKDKWDSPVMECQTPNSFTNLIFSSPDLAEGTYTLWSGDTQFAGAPGEGGFGGGMGGFVGGFQPIDKPDWPGRGEGGGDVEIPPQPTIEYQIQGGEPPADWQPENMPVGQPPEGFDPSQMPAGPMPQGGADMPMPEMPGGVQPPQGGNFGGGPYFVVTGLSPEFTITQGANYFYSVMGLVM